MTDVTSISTERSWRTIQKVLRVYAKPQLEVDRYVLEKSNKTYQNLDATISDRELAEIERLIHSDEPSRGT